MKSMPNHSAFRKRNPLGGTTDPASASKRDLRPSTARVVFVACFANGKGFNTGMNTLPKLFASFASPVLCVLNTLLLAGILATLVLILLHIRKPIELYEPIAVQGAEETGMERQPFGQARPIRVKMDEYEQVHVWVDGQDGQPHVWIDNQPYVYIANEPLNVQLSR